MEFFRIYSLVQCRIFITLRLDMSFFTYYAYSRGSLIIINDIALVLWWFLISPLSFLSGCLYEHWIFSTSSRNLLFSILLCYLFFCPLFVLFCETFPILSIILLRFLISCSMFWILHYFPFVLWVLIVFLFINISVLTFKMINGF